MGVVGCPLFRQGQARRRNIRLMALQFGKDVGQVEGCFHAQVDAQFLCQSFGQCILKPGRSLLVEVVGGGPVAAHHNQFSPREDLRKRIGLLTATQ